MKKTVKRSCIVTRVTLTDKPYFENLKVFRTAMIQLVVFPNGGLVFEILEKLSTNHLMPIIDPFLPSQPALFHSNMSTNKELLLWVFNLKAVSSGAVWESSFVRFWKFYSSLLNWNILCFRSSKNEFHFWNVPPLLKASLLKWVGFYQSASAS